MRRRLALSLALLVACSETGVPYVDAIYEPMTVSGAQFVPGALPGSPPPDGGTTSTGDAGPPPGVQVTFLQAPNAVAIPGAAGKAITGRATANAVAIGLRFLDLGTGYWVLPTGSPDPQFPGESAWSANVDFNPDIKPGFHELAFAALDENGNSGEEAELDICAASRIPDNYSSCEPSDPPPDAVFTVMWDVDADLDIQVTTPDGTVVDPKNPTTELVDAGKPGPNVGVIDRDSLANCVPDGLRQEDLIFQQRPSGTFTIAVNMFSACNTNGATFTVIVNEASGTVPNRRFVETFRRSGHLGSFEANGGLAPGLFVVQYPFGN